MPLVELGTFMEIGERLGRYSLASAERAPRVKPRPASIGPERTRMSHLLGARPKAVAQRGRVVAPLVGVLALVLALFAMTAPAGATARHATKPPADKPAQKHDDAAGQAKDNHQGQPNKDNHQGQPNKDNHQGQPNKDNHQGQPNKDGEADCDSSGPGNPCHPPQKCGQNSGPGNANDTCPAANPECPGANAGPGNAQDVKVKGPKDGHAKKQKNDKGRHGHKVRGHEKAANCPAVNDECEAGKVKKDDGTCIALAECAAAGGVVKDGKCVVVEDKCEAGKVKQGDMCVAIDECKAAGGVVKDDKCITPDDCKAAGGVVKDGMCVAANECTPPNVIVDGECKQPVNNEGCPVGQVRQPGGGCADQTPVCTAPQVLQGGVCVTPTTTVAGGQQANQPAGQTTQPAPTSTVAGTQTRS